MAGSVLYLFRDYPLVLLSVHRTILWHLNRTIRLHGHLKEGVPLRATFSYWLCLKLDHLGLRANATKMAPNV